MRKEGTPIIYEINTATWLSALSRQEGRTVTLATIPEAEYTRLQLLHVDAVWLMGVWKRSQRDIEIVREDPQFEPAMRQVLPDFSFDQDVIGSAYSISAYEVAERFGGQEALATARAKLAKRGMRLILDFVPNHMATDSDWVLQHPEHFLQGTEEELTAQPKGFFRVGNAVLANGKDPNFLPWSDVAQVNAFSKAWREMATTTLLKLAALCDGLRCDMAMLVLNAVFQDTWKERAGTPPAEEFWGAAIQAVKTARPEFLFLAEAYWNTEQQLHAQGFDYTYDKKFYDALLRGDTGALTKHLRDTAGYQNKLIRFIENHDEPRIAGALSPEAAKAAAWVLATVPGAKLYHDGQLSGEKIRVPVQLGRGPETSTSREASNFYTNTQAVQECTRRPGAKWSLISVSQSSVAAWEWQLGSERLLVMVNLSNAPVETTIQPKSPVRPGTYSQNLADGETIWTAAEEKLTGQLLPWQVAVLELSG